MITSSWKKIHHALIAFLFLLYPLLSLQYGITCDERIHNIHGKTIVDYYFGKSTIAIMDPFNNDGSVTPVTTDDYSPQNKGLNLQGDFLDVVFNFIYRALPMFGEYELKHILNSLFGVGLILVISLLVKDLSNYRAAVIAILLCALYPRLLAHSMNNPKDLPFAFFYALTLWQVIKLFRNYPTVNPWNVLLLVTSLAFAIDTRIMALLLFALTGMYLFFYLFRIISTEDVNAARGKQLRQLIILIFGILFAGYIFSSLLWPWGSLNPLTAPIRAFFSVNANQAFDSIALFGGERVHSWDIPRMYLPTYLFIISPILALVGVLMFLILLFAKKFTANTLEIYWLLIAAAFPIFYVVILKSNVYDDGRHLLFTIPIFLCLAAMSFEQGFQLLNTSKLKWAAIISFSIMAIEPLYFSIKNHPEQQVYFNPIVGGVAGTYGMYEHDYWGNSYRQAVEWVVENCAPSDTTKKIRLFNFYGSKESVNYYIRNHKGFEYADKGINYDYGFFLPAIDKFRPGLIKNWPPKYLVYEVKIDGVPIVGVVRNPARVP